MQRSIAGASRRKLLNYCFAWHAVLSAVVGIAALVFPHLVGVFFGEALHNTLRYNPPGEAKVAHIALRFYGALTLGQAYIVWNARYITEGEVRRCFVQAYAFVFGLSLLVLLRAHFTEPHWALENLSWARWVLNWALILFFLTLTLGYSWFAIMQPPVIFEGLGHSA